MREAERSKQSAILKTGKSELTKNTETNAKKKRQRRLDKHSGSKRSSTGTGGKQRLRVEGFPETHRLLNAKENRRGRERERERV
ncbi:hypothetical protein U1Q18_004652 [Sarracenia purpurea var. burkii]